MASKIDDFLLAHSHMGVETVSQVHNNLEWIIWQTWDFLSDQMPLFLPDGSQLLSLKLVACILCSASEVEFRYG